jgi:hypothetical protein
MGLASLAMVLAVAPAAAADDPVESESTVASDGHPLDDPEEGGASHAHEHEDALFSIAGGGTMGPFFNESGGCFEPSGITPPMTTTNSTSNRSIPSGHQVRGPWGDFYGRDYGDVSGSMVNWTVPMSGGRVVRVHERALPAFQQVTANLAAESAKGNFYDVRITGSWVWRRVGGSWRMSTHAFGSTIDINWDTNPYSSANVLVTDMPEWFIQAWRDAGFCWGGDWQTIKDSMHFSWKGPLRTPGYGSLPTPYAPITAAGDYTQVPYGSSTAFGVKDPSSGYFFGDGNADGAPDLFRVTEYADNDLLIEYARSSRDFDYCGVSETVVPGGSAGPGEILVADYDGDGRPDVWRVNTRGSVVELTVHTYAEKYRDAIEITTEAPVFAKAAYGAADYDRDGIPDLYVIERKGATVVHVFDGASDFTDEIVDTTTSLPATSSTSKWHFALADVDVDGVPDVVVIRVDGDVQLNVLDGSAAYAGAASIKTTGATADESGLYSMGDWDGDGRPDLLSYRSNGSLQAYLGGVQSGSSDFWFQNSGWACNGNGSTVPWDVNADRIAELVVGVPFDDVSGVVDAGLINVLYGSLGGPVTSTDQVWHQNSSGVEGSAEEDDRFGSAIAWGDFDNDGIGDLAVGAPFDDVGAIADAGLINVYFGTSAGLSGADNQMIHQDTAGIFGSSQTNDQFGSSLAAGDFDGDGWDDLAIGAPKDLSRAGVVNVLYGSKLGLIDDGNQLWYQDAWAVPDVSQSGDAFGASLTVGDFDDDGYDDLAIGAPGDKVGGENKAGLVTVLYGSASGLSATGSQSWHQKNASIPGTPNENDKFGAALSAGDYDGDGFDDLAIGVPGEDVDGKVGAGQVHVLFGRSTGLKANNNQVINQNSPGIAGISKKGNALGSSLASGDMDGDGFFDLAIGVPFKYVTASRAGAVLTLKGSIDGLSRRGDVQWRQGLSGLVGTSERGDRFGSALRFADLNGDGYDDLIVGLPTEDLNAVDTGAVIVIYSTEDGLTAVGSEVWHQDVSGVEGAGGTSDRMGSL